MITPMARSSSAPPEGPPPRRATREALNLTGRPYLSHSQLSTFRGCPRKFAFLYVEKSTPEFQAATLLFGSAMHAVFESHYRALLEGRSPLAGDHLHTFLESWKIEQENRGADVPIRFNKGQDMSALTELAQRMIEAFMASPLSTPHGQIVGIEEPFSVVIDPDLPDILAKVDLVTQTPGCLHVIDFKTSRSKWTPERAEESAEQLLLYGRTVRNMARGVGLPVQLHFAVLTKAKKPVVQVLDVPADESRLSNVRDHVAQVWDAVKAGNYFPSPSIMNCSTCPFKNQCPAFHGSTSTTMPATSSDAGDLI